MVDLWSTSTLRWLKQASPSLLILYGAEKNLTLSQQPGCQNGTGNTEQQPEGGAARSPPGALWVYLWISVPFLSPDKRPAPFH